ncbi:MAG TPA: hypothetical protein PK959_13010 [Candidatus Competibacteraceae bacterium]|nr:hypothetical protein [Candidatus Competibacteraceae bacterium]
MSVITANRPNAPNNAQIAVAAAMPVIYAAASLNETLPWPINITAVPGAGTPAGTLLVEYQTTSSGAWMAWPSGAVSVTTTYLLTGPVYALRFTADTQDGVVELAQ